MAVPINWTLWVRRVRCKPRWISQGVLLLLIRIPVLLLTDLLLALILTSRLAFQRIHVREAHVSLTHT